MMKQNDIAMVILVASISLLLAYWLGGVVINSPEQRSTTVEIAVPISEEFAQPSEKIFSENSVNPTGQIKIGEQDKSNPFDAPN